MATKTDFFGELQKATNNEFASLVDDGVDAGDVTGFIDTGAYILNGLTSGDLFKGIPNSKITAFVGESATGKTFFVLGIVRQFLEDNPEGGVMYFESESAISKDMIVERGIDPKRIRIVPVTTIQEFRTQAISVIDKYLAFPEKERKPLLMVLDSLGQLSTTKEVNDSAAGLETKDMTRAGLVRGAFRVLTLKLGRAKVPLLMTNHVYAAIGGMFPTNEVAGGGGLKYSASNIVVLSKRKEKDGTDVIGNIIHCKNYKARLTKENKVVDVLLTYDKGLDRYYGLLPLALKYGIFEKVGNKVKLPDGITKFEKQINNNPTKYFTQEILEKLNVAAATEFKYGSATNQGGVQESDDHEENVESETTEE